MGPLHEDWATTFASPFRRKDNVGQLALIAPELKGEIQSETAYLLLELKDAHSSGLY
jgi:hypothetical protein